MQTLLVAPFLWTLFHFSFVLGTKSVSTSTASSAPASPTSAHMFAWNVVSNMVACQPATVSWLYSPIGTTEMSISITNNNVVQREAPSATAGRRTLSAHAARGVRRGSASASRLRRALGMVDQPITTFLIDPAMRNFTWAAVNVSAGWYILQATFHGASDSHAELSTAFYVDNGTDLSCLSSAASPVPQPSGTSGRATPTRGTSKRPAIIGGVLAGLVVVAGVTTACARYYRRRAARLAAESAVTVYTSTIFPRTAELSSKERREYLTNQLAAVQTQLAALHKTATAAGATVTPVPLTDPPSATPAETDGALRTQNGALQARIRTLEEQLQSQWALGLSDEPPPEYLE
ncbi:hypothetical protein GGX14DRAFT_453188 [Mycena pura]|uniref:Membrane-associated protein n=1 Tax=Mycena pura TaxID=153505 RepID=A0AAD6VDL3_9AGAR|nr:hypothetical protein GGX14DRAFT_453188 [Mycena pura]